MPFGEENRLPKSVADATSFLIKFGFAFSRRIISGKWGFGSIGRLRLHVSFAELSRKPNGIFKIYNMR